MNQNLIEQRYKLNNLLLFGMEEKKQVGKSLEDTVVKFLNDKLSVNLTQSDVDMCFRIGKFSDKNSTNPRPILLRFLSYKVRRSVFDRKKMLKSSGISIKEDLTTTASKILRAAMEKYGKHRVWTLDGRVYALINNIKKCLSDHSFN
uniref:Uncharacterized protein LOC114346326 n=1 Tax=Diabrotica virgifera virgifera TaxID=50390 RepID=A0A6P7HAJ8_DIAVI